jgi:triacylglycerol lipase
MNVRRTRFECRNEDETTLSLLADQSRKPRYDLRVIPIVLHHGFLAFGQIRLGRLRVCNFRHIHSAIAQRGHPIIMENIHPTASIQRRARMLKQSIQTSLERMGQQGERVIIFAHSMGGLDCRYMITHLNMAKSVAALVTVCTPHRGSPYADWAMRNLGDRLGGRRLVTLLNLDVNALLDLTVDRCRAFNEQTPDMPRVRYYSISAARPWHRVPPFYYHSHRIISLAEGENDGLVSVASARWGKHLATWPVDHLHATNRRLVVEVRDPTGDVTPRYLDVLDQVQKDLAEQKRAE